MKTIIFARVSTNIQEYDRQVNELTALAKSKGWGVEAVFAEKISGAKANAERTELLNMVAYVEANAINKVLDLIYQQTNELRVGKKENGESFSTFSVSVPRPGIEPGWVAPLVFETSASTDSAIWAIVVSQLRVQR